MQALPAGPAPAPQRQLLVGATFAAMAMVMLMGAMLAVWMSFRNAATDLGESFVPSGVTIPEVPTNVMLIAFVGLLVFVQWAVWSATRHDRGHTVFALAITALMAILIINAQAFVYSEMGMPVADGTYAALFYSITGAFMALMIIGLLVTAVAAFRYVGGRDDTALLTAHAIYWYATATIYAAMWFVVYVTK
jgi:cytochrome c oxidase subunit 3